MSSAMADSNRSYNRIHFPRELNSSSEIKGTKPAGKVLSFTHYFRKFLFFAVFLIAIPLFPSQAPDFINQTILTKFWELVHLLFIGIAVSYGLFCRRNVDVEIESQPNTDDSQSYVSRVFDVSSVFEDGFDDSYGYGEKNVYQNWYSESYKSEQSKARSLNCETGFENSYGYGDNYISQAWNSQNFLGESMVVVNRTTCAVNEYGHQSLGLPVRSLRSRVNQDNQESTEISNGRESGFSAVSSNSPTESVNETFGDFGPMNLENTFNESAAANALSSPIPWCSVSGRMEMSENVDMASRSSRFRPLSVDETQFESLKSRFFLSSGTFSSQTSLISDSPSRLSPSLTSSSTMERFKMDELGKEQAYRNSYPPASKPENGKPSLNAFHIRRYTNGSLFEKKMQKSSEDDLKDRVGNKREDQLGSVKGSSSSLKLDRDTAKHVKSSSRGKSVRTIRSRGFAAEAMKIGERSGKPSDEVEAVYKGKSELKSGVFLDNLSENPRKQGLDNQASMPKSTHSELQKKKHKEPSEIFAVESKEKSRYEAENFQVKSDEESVTNSVHDAETDSNEVDKKAGEFIAKFKEQIRLQKMASIDKSSREVHHFR